MRVKIAKYLSCEKLGGIEDKSIYPRYRIRSQKTNLDSYTRPDTLLFLLSILHFIQVRNHPLYKILVLASSDSLAIIPEGIHLPLVLSVKNLLSRCIVKFFFQNLLLEHIDFGTCCLIKFSGFPLSR